MKTVFTIIKWMLWAFAFFLLALGLLYGQVGLIIFFGLAFVLMFPLWDKLITWRGFEGIRIPTVLMLWFAAFCVMTGTGVSIDFDEKPANTVTASQARFAGTVRGNRPVLKVNGVEIPINNGRFEYVQELNQGFNRIEFNLKAYYKETDQTPHEEKKTFRIARVTQESLDWPNSSGSINKSTMNCSQEKVLSFNYKGKCSGTFEMLSGSTFIEVMDGRGQSATFNRQDHLDEPVATQLQASVESGKVRVSIREPDGTLKTGTATPGNPVTISGLSVSTRLKDEDYGIRVKFESLEGKSGTVSYTVAFDFPADNPAEQ